MSLINRLLNRLTEFSAPLAPDRSFFAVGDVHGRLDLLMDLLEALPEKANTLVLVGDYIDRGEASSGVLQYVRALQKQVGAEQVICLRGNHEDMMLRFIDDPIRNPGWLRNGGVQTLASFGIAVPRSEPTAGEMLDLAADLRSAMGAELLGWLRGLPTMWRSGNVAVVHAAADPTRPLEEQSEDTLLWGHPDFRKIPRADNAWIVHGHTIVDRPVAEAGIISVDTGAFSTGHLTAALVTRRGVEFIST